MHESLFRYTQINQFKNGLFQQHYCCNLADCRGNHTVNTKCGPSNGCMGSMEDWVCVCEADGWKAVEGDMKMCHKSKKKIHSPNFASNIKRIQA